MSTQEIMDCVLNETMRQPDILSKFQAIGAEPIGSTPQALATHLQHETTRWGQLIKERGIRMQ